MAQKTIPGPMLSFFKMKNLNASIVIEILRYKQKPYYFIYQDEIQY